MENKLKYLLLIIMIMLASAMNVSAQNEPEATPEPTEQMDLDYYDGDIIARSPDGRYRVVVHEQGTAIWPYSGSPTLITSDEAFEAQVNNNGEFALLIEGSLVFGDVTDVVFDTLESREGTYTRVLPSWNGSFCAEQLMFTENSITLGYTDTTNVDCATRFSGNLWADAFTVYTEVYNDAPETLAEAPETLEINDTTSMTIEDGEYALVVNGTSFLTNVTGSYLYHSYDADAATLSIWTTTGLNTGQLRAFAEETQNVDQKSYIMASETCAAFIETETLSVVISYRTETTCSFSGEQGFELMMDIHPPSYDAPTYVHYDMSDQVLSCWIPLGQSIAILDGEALYIINGNNIVGNRPFISNERFEYPDDLPEDWVYMFNQYTARGVAEDLISLNGAQSDPESGTPYCRFDNQWVSR